MIRKDASKSTRFWDLYILLAVIEESPRHIRDVNSSIRYLEQAAWPLD